MIQNKKGFQFVIWTLALSFFCGAIVFGRITFINLYYTITSDGWLRHTAKLIDVNIKQKERLHVRLNQDQRIWKVYAKYTYSYKGISYTSDKYSFIEKWGNQEVISDGNRLKHQLKHNEGNILIYINPKHPEEAVISRGEKNISSIFGIITMIFTLISLVFFYMIFRTAKRN